MYPIFKKISLIQNSNNNYNIETDCYPNLILTAFFHSSKSLLI